MPKQICLTAIEAELFKIMDNVITVGFLGFSVAFCCFIINCSFCYKRPGEWGGKSSKGRRGKH